MIDVALFACGFTHHRKVRKLSSDAFRLWVTAIDHAKQDKSGGFVAPDDIECYPRSPRGDALDAAIGELVELGLWDPIDGGWLIHDFEEWQAGPAERQPEPYRVDQPDTPSWSPKPSQLGGAARIGAARTPAGTFAKRQPDNPAGPADSEPKASRTPAGGAACFPPHPLSDQKDGESREKRESGSGAPTQPENKGSGRARRTRIPGDFRPTVEHEARATKDGLDLADECARFKSHAEATGRLMANWNAAFTTWLMNSKRFAPRGGAARRGGPVQPSHGKTGFEDE